MLCQWGYHTSLYAGTPSSHSAEAGRTAVTNVVKVVCPAAFGWLNRAVTSSSLREREVKEEVVTAHKRRSSPQKIGVGC